MHCIKPNIQISYKYRPSYKKKILKRNQELPHIQVLELPWIDTPEQILEKNELKSFLTLIHTCQNNVLVHCAQGKSRSGVVCICYLGWNHL